MASVAEQVGYDGAKQIKGRKRHIAVDVLGLVLAALTLPRGYPKRWSSIK